MNNGVEALIAHLSEQPWSSYTKADYSIEQWHNACLIHLHTGTPTSKNECKLPVKTPNGALNRNGVHAAAAALAGARGGVHASPEQKASAARALRGYYSKMNEDPPPSLKQSAIEEFIEHHGVKGMRWGVRRSRASVSRPRSGEHRTVSELRKRPASQLTNRQLKLVNERLNLEQNYGRLNPTRVQIGQAKVRGLIAGLGTAASLYALMHSPAGKAAIAAGKTALHKRHALKVVAKASRSGQLRLPGL